MKKIYLYPKLDKSKLLSPNLYIDNLEESISSEYDIVNKEPNNVGVIDFLKYLPKTDAYFFNWIENLTNLRFGKIQLLVFVIFLYTAKYLLRKKIIWVLHNKYTHKKYGDSAWKNFWERYLFNLMVRKSNHILTHSNSGIDFVKERFPKHSNKVNYLIHPTDTLYKKMDSVPVKYDILLWGTIHPYKGISEFLEFAKESGQIEKLNILILGVCPNRELKEKISRYYSNKLTHIEKFFDFDEIANYANQSRYVLFTYNSDSVLSSGSLMDTIRMGSLVIGPNKGAFKDLSTESFIDTYNSYEDIIKILNENKVKKESIYPEIVKFCTENSWNRYVEKLNACLK